ncbi:lung adenoma susceptibility protein 2 [Heptranchias perlo]|uniref:lung adenoma susceptibility protein 2 n=1 Tax=Heptranchias perlo TaxID=212740 RepID=UPI003559A2B4
MGILWLFHSGWGKRRSSNRCKVHIELQLHGGHRKGRDLTGSFQAATGDVVSNISQSAIHAFTDPMFANAKNFITFPMDNQKQQDRAPGFASIAGFLQVHSTKNCTHTAMRAPTDEPAPFMNCKGFYPMNVQLYIKQRGRWAHTASAPTRLVPLWASGASALRPNCNNRRRRKFVFGAESEGLGAGAVRAETPRKATKTKYKYETKPQDVMSTIGMKDGMDFYSPESTVSGLLVSAGHLSSSDRSHGSTQFRSSILYGGRTYQSASEALEAYIDNFEKRLPSPARAANKLYLGSSSKQFSTSPCSKREVFKERHPFKDLDFPSRPLRRRIASDPDLASLTTDDLLGMPPDGSLPLTRSSVLRCLTQTDQHLGSHFDHRYPYTSTKHTPKSSPEYSEDWHRNSFALLCEKTGYSQFNRTAGLKPSRVSHLGTSPREKDKYMTPSIPSSLPAEDCRFGKHRFDSNSWQNYPRWLTSQKSELGVSGITSIPELKYPCWLQDCDLESDSCGQKALNQREYPLSTRFETELTDSRLYSGTARYRPKNKQFANYLESADRTFQKHTERGVRSTLRSTPLHATRFAHCNTEEVEDSHCSKPFRDDHIDLLIQKAEKVLEAFSQRMTSPQQNYGSPGTEEVLEADRSWDNPPVMFKSPVPVGNSGEDCFEASHPALIDDSLQDSLNTGHQRNRPGSTGISGGKHHGPVEALKQMLFSLQTVQQSFDDEHTEQHEEIRKIPENIMSQTHGLDFEGASGSKSLQRALNHLRHLKELVDDIGAKKEKEAQRNRYE